MFSRADSTVVSFPKIRHAFVRASSASSCKQDDAGLSALETLDTLRVIVSNEAGSNACQVHQSVVPHSVLTNNHWRAENAIDKKSGKKSRQLNRHRSWPTSNAAAADNIVISQDLIDRTSARKTIATRTSSSVSRGTRQMVEFCETERLRARSLNAKANSGALTNCSVKSAGSPLICVISQTWLVVLCMLFAILWTSFYQFRR